MAGEPEDLARAIVDWSRGRPRWERQALRMLALGQAITDSEVEYLADLAQQEAAGGPAPSLPSLEVGDVGIGREGDEAVQLLGISQPVAINALTWLDGIDFAPEGVTLVYGENGSGKSGYARVLKKVTRARHDVEVLSDVFQAPADQSARLALTVGETRHNLDWPSDHPAYLSRVSFYDSGCAHRYVSTETEVAYRPGSIGLLDDLVALAGRVRARLEERRSICSTNLAPLPALPAESRAAEFAASISSATTALEIDIASELPADVDERLEVLRGRMANLAVQDVAKREAELSAATVALDETHRRIAFIRTLLSDERVSAALQARVDAQAARQAADAAGMAAFASLPLAGAGTDAWRLLWDAARRFSEQAAYPDERFPVLNHHGDAGRCVLCHQQLDEQAADRLRLFEEFVTAEAERLARETATQFEQLASEMRNLVVIDTESQLRLQQIASVGSEAHDELRTVLVSLTERRDRTVQALAGEEIEIDPLGVMAPLPRSESLREELDRMLTDLKAEDQQAQWRELKRAEDEILGRRALRDARAVIDERVASLKEIHVVDEAIRLTDTRGTTRRAADLTRTHVSDVMKHHFSQETLRLGLERVRLADAGGGQGNLRHRAQLVGAVQRASVDAVLSEGEQTALGLAGFLTEVETEPSGSAVVFDDPVTSLDHVRRERVARRVVELGRDRQVIIFTHDVAFVVDLKRAADAESIAVTERWVSKANAHVGQVTEGGPWDARMVRQRIDGMAQRLAEVRTVYASGDPAASHEAARAWYQDLRTVWERALEEVVIGPVQVRGRLELRPSNLKVFVRFTEADDDEFQAAFTKCGDRGSHDRSTELNRPLPAVDELEADLEVLRQWHRRVRQYQS